MLGDQNDSTEIITKWESVRIRLWPLGNVSLSSSYNIYKLHFNRVSSSDTVLSSRWPCISTKFRQRSTSSKANFEHGHPAGLALHCLGLELQDLSTGEKDLEVAVTICTDGHNVLHSDPILQHSLAGMEDQQLVGVEGTCREQRILAESYCSTETCMKYPRRYFSSLRLCPLACTYGSLQLTCMCCIPLFCQHNTIVQVS